MPIEYRIETTLISDAHASLDDVETGINTLAGNGWEVTHFIIPDPMPPQRVVVVLKKET